MEYTSQYHKNAINKFPHLPPEEAIAEYRKLTAKAGLQSKGRKAPWATFANKEKAKEFGKLGATTRWSKIK